MKTSLRMLCSKFSKLLDLVWECSLACLPLSSLSWAICFVSYFHQNLTVWAGLAVSFLGSLTGFWAQDFWSAQRREPDQTGHRYAGGKKKTSLMTPWYVRFICSHVPDEVDPGCELSVLVWGWEVCWLYKCLWRLWRSCGSVQMLLWESGEISILLVLTFSRTFCARLRVLISISNETRTRW